jgi:serine protease
MRHAFLIGGSICLLACAAEAGTVDSVGGRMSFEEFRDAAHLEPFEGGVFIVDGDIPAVDEEALEQLYFDMVLNEDALAVQTFGGRDGIWNTTERQNLTYCVSTTFGDRYATVVSAMAAAAGAWEAVAGVNYTHVSAEDSRCSRTNTSVLFDVNPVSTSSYLARAFFPGQSRSSRNVLVASSAFRSSTPLVGILRHELGHTLGFLHEHIRRPRTICPEGGSYRGLTEYDPGSVMHYPDCGGTNFRLELSALDITGVQSVYGGPATGMPAPPTPTPPATGRPQTGAASGTVTRGTTRNYAPLDVLAGTSFRVAMTGTGDADLYLRWNDAPTTSTYDCRPFRSDANETCELTVPSGVTAAHIAVNGYTDATYRFDVSWTAP